MISSSLKKSLKAGEGERAEFKKSLAERDQVLETVSAFSNTGGGVILIGVDPNGKVTGVDVGKNTLETLANEIKLKTDPKIFPSINVVEVSGKQIIQVGVDEHPVKPVWIGDKVFERVGRTNQRVPLERIRQLIRESQPVQWDQTLLRDSRPAEIDSRAVRHFLVVAKEERNIALDSVRSAVKALEKMHLSQKGRLTTASILLFGKDPQHRFPQACVQCARFRGTNTDEFEDMKVFAGTIIDQVADTLVFLKEHIQVRARVGPEPERVEEWEYPREALREAVINAICHRDYQDPGQVQVRVFDDRLEIWSPGTLLPGLGISDLKGDHQSQPRNALIARSFFLLKFIEQWGTGTNRILNLCKQAGLPEPQFSEKSGSFVVAFRRSTRARVQVSSVGLNETQAKILKFIEKQGSASPKEIAAHFQLGPRAVRKNIAGMLHHLVWMGKSSNDPTGRYKPAHHSREEESRLKKPSK